MTKTKLYAIVILLYMLTPVCIFGALGTMVNSKYEVDEKYWLVDGNDKLTSDQKEKEIQSLDEKGRKYKIKTYALSSAALLCFLVSTGLLIKRKNIIKQ